MKSQTRRRLEHLFVARVMRRGKRIARWMPLRTLRGLADVLAYLAMAVTPRRQRVADANIAATFPAMSAAERKRVRRRSTCNVMRTMLETLKLSSLSPAQVDALIEPVDLTAVREAHREGRGLILVSAHFGNWEVLGAYVAHLLGGVAVVAREGGDARKNALINDGRERHGVQVLGRNDVLAMLRLLKSGGALAILPDQHAADGGVQMDFLGRPAWVFTGPALLAQRTNARVFVGFCVRYGNDPFRLEVFPEVQLADCGDRDADVVENTRRINRLIEQAILAHPDNYLWLHRRWKAQRPRPSEDTETATSLA